MAVWEWGGENPFIIPEKRINFKWIRNLNTKSETTEV